MSGFAYVVPVAAVVASTTASGAVTLARLAAESADLRPEAIAEQFPSGWVATVTYALPGSPGRVHCAHVPLVWAPEGLAVRA